jgi:hypothetical protein
MRSQPAHISRDTHVANGRCAPPAETKARKQRAFTPCRLDKPPSISADERLISYAVASPLRNSMLTSSSFVFNALSSL